MRRWLTLGTLYLFLGSAVLCSQPRENSSNEDERGAIQDVIRDYIRGWRTGDTEILSRVFATAAGTILWPSGDLNEEISSMTFGAAIARGKKNPQFGERWKLVSLDIVDDQLAAAKVEISRRGGSYIDYLLLYKVESQWRIVAKTFVVR